MPGRSPELPFAPPAAADADPPAAAGSAGGDRRASAASDPRLFGLQPVALTRFVRLALAVGLLLLFRRLLVLLVFFVAFERSIGTVASLLAARLRVPRRASVAVVSLATLLLLGGSIALGAGRALRAALAMRHTLPDRIAAVRQTDLYQRIEEQLAGAGGVVEGASRYAGSALEYAATLGHLLLFAVIGFILAVVFLLEQGEVEEFAAAQDPAGLAGTLLRWLGHLADAVSVTLQFQMVVAAVNAVLTLPVMLAVGIPHAAAFFFMVFFSGMVPVVGNFVAGAILTLLAYQARGLFGVLLFSGLTFVLHKLESYYLNPRLAARHVHLPGFVLIVSLILWEQVAGFAGLFLSFPFLFIANRIRNEFRAEDRARDRGGDRPGPPPAR